MGNVVNFFTGNLILNLAILAWAIAQGLKIIITFCTKKKLDWHYLVASGGMPSSHSAFVCACASSVGYMYGWGSPMFGIAAVLAIVVMYDAANVRKETGEQAKILNYIMKNWDEYKPELFAEELKELIGHTPLQVAAGAVLGVVVWTAGAYFLL